MVWSRERQDGQDWLRLSWTEHGVKVAPRRMREGFGTELITRRVPYELKGRGTLEMRDTGLDATIAIPLVPGESILQTDAEQVARVGELQ